MKMKEHTPSGGMCGALSDGITPLVGLARSSDGHLLNWGGGVTMKHIQSAVSDI